MQAQDLRELIELLIWILVESSKMNVIEKTIKTQIKMNLNNKLTIQLKEKEINESLELVGIKQELIKIINTSITDNQEQIKSYLRNLRMEVPSYSNLEWRVDIKLSTTTDRKIIEPEINFKLNLVKGDNKQEEAHILLTDVVNLVHLTNGLEEALNEIKTNYCRRVFRNIVQIRFNEQIL